MKKFIFLLAMITVVAALIAAPTVARPQKDTPGPAKYPNRAIFYTEDFESGAAGWTHFDGAVSPNMWHIYNNGDAQGDCWWMGDPALAAGTGIGGYYDHQYLVLDTPASTIAAGSTTLTFKMRLNMEEPGGDDTFNGWDSFNIRISDNNGISWSVIPTTLITPGYDFTSSYAFGSEHGETPPVPAWGGVHEPWETVSVDLSGYVGSSVKIRFAFASDPAFNTVDDPAMYGAMVDDIAFGTYTNSGVDDSQMSYSSLVPTAGDFWHVATDATAPSPTHIMSSVNSAGTYVPFMLNYLESPSILLPADATQIVADFQMKGTYFDAGVFPDVDYFGWEVSPDNGVTWRYMSNPSADPDGMNYVYSGAPDTWASMIASYTLDGDITLFAGNTVKFRWYFQSNGNTPIGTPLQIDDFQIFSVTAAPAPPNLVYPLNNQANLPYTGFDFDWTVSSLGAFPDYYTIYVDAVLENLEPLSFAPSYSHEILPVYNPADSLYYLSSYCPSGDILDFTMAAGQTWYWTVVASIADQDDAFSEIWRFDTVPASAVITTFPWNEDFEEAGALPAGWTVGDVDNDAVTWAPYSSTTYSHSPTYSMRHLYSDLVPDPGQNGWLVSPPIQLPAEGVGVFTFWSYNLYPSYTVHNGVWINTDPNPLDPYWVNVWEQTDLTTQAWVQKTIDVSAYNGNIIYIAFKYTGFDANAWHIDDVNLAFYTSDVLAPILSGHLPVLNTPREDLTWPVAVNVQDDAVFNNPITAVNLYWSLDGGATWSPAIAMTNTSGTTYEGTLPAQILGSTVTYKFEAFDSLNNMASAQYSYSVADPVWIWYDTGGTGYSGFPTYNWGPAVWFENPFYGTDTAVKLLGSDGALYNNNAGNPPTTVNMNIYGEDFEGNLTPLMPTLPVVFNHNAYTTVDLSSYNIQITTPWFWISYEDMGLAHYFLFDATYDYTTPTYLFIGG
ncbi:MAG TPA: choice-of-anchor J domain-containing protein, partial [Candidatus Syntrophosphaera sp.]|nr:choice-of-anchor J domain-containing protein [Candidatus Syntrophosphaera sp.]